MPDDQDSVIDIYQRHAQAYDQRRSRRLFERVWLDRFLSLMPAQREILDLGCGSGEPIARYLIERGGRITGVDSSDALLGLCAARFPLHSWILGDMRMLALSRRFHGLIAWDSMFHLPHQDQRDLFQVFGAHSAAGAALMFTSGSQAGERIGSFEGEPLYHASLDEQEYRDLLNDHGFEVVAYSADDLACEGHTIWLAKART